MHLKNLSILIPLICIFSFTKKEVVDDIRWSDDKKLSWEDFTAPVPDNTGDAALTSTYVGFSYSVNRGKISFSIECKFQKNRSWVRMKSDYILKHEQGHFDIAEIFARKLNKGIKEYLATNNRHEGLTPIYNKLMDEKRAMQEQYDSETDHSIQKEKQAAWNLKIEMLLRELEPHKKYSAN